MRSKALLVFAAAVVVTLGLSGSIAADADSTPSGGQAPDEAVAVIIGYFDDPDDMEDLEDIQELGGTVKYVYHLIPAIAALLPASALRELEDNVRVDVIDLDIDVHAVYAELDNAWGVKRVGSGAVHDAGNKGSGVSVAVVDSGIYYTHPDLNANYAGGYDFVNSDNDPMDDNGHGTHVAGSAGAEDDGAGVVGVAPAVSLYALKVLNASGGGSYSDVIAALQWAVDNAIQVANHSYGSAGNPGSLVKAAFDAAEAAGVINVGAAGNDGTCAGTGDSVIYPARWDSVIAVAATNITDGVPCFSSTGPDVELAAPGVSINSTLAGGGHGTKSGTSMASPHVAGTAALVLASGNLTDQDGDGDVDAVDVRLKLRNTAEDIGQPTTWAGYGLVDAQAATADAGTPPPPPPPDTTRTLTVVDGYDEKEETTLEQEGKTSVLQASDNEWWPTEEDYFTAFEFSDVSIPTDATITSVIVEVEHWEESGYQGSVEWAVGTGWPNSPTVWGSNTSVPLRKGEQSEAKDSWDVTSLVSDAARVDALEVRIQNGASDGRKTLTDHLSVVVEYSIGPVNAAPEADDGTAITSEDTAIEVTLAASDPEECELSFSVVEGPTNGTLSALTAQTCVSGSPNTDSGKLSYAPDANFDGSDSFTFKVNDGVADSATATVSITVTAVNDAPVAYDQSVAAKEDNPVAIALTGSDVDGDPLSYTVTSLPTHGSLSDGATTVATVPYELLGSSVTYSPGAAYSGPDGFTFTVNDATVASVPGTVSIDVAANSTPVADDQPVATAEDAAVPITLTGSDADGDRLTFTVGSGPSNGSLSGTGPERTYTPNADYNGSDSFTFSVNDGYADSSLATVSLTVTPVNDAPVAADQWATTAEDTAKPITLTASDVDGDMLTFSVVTGPSNGSLSGTVPDLSYTPSADFNGPDSFTYTASDGSLSSDTATVAITVEPVNDVPVATNDSAATYEGTATAITVLANDTDADGDLLSVMNLTQPSHGSAVLNPDSTVTYTPNTGFVGTDSFTYTANDGTAASNVATVAIAVDIKSFVGEGLKLSKNADFSTEDTLFELGETMYILVWSDQLDVDNIKEARWQLEGAEESLTNNLDGTYTGQVLIDDNVKQLSPEEVVESDSQVQIEDESGHQLQLEVQVALVGPPSTASSPSD